MRVLPSAVVVLHLGKKVCHFIMNFAHFSLKTRIAQPAFTVSSNIFTVVIFQNILKNVIKNLFSNISPYSKATCEERKFAYHVKTFAANCVIYRTQIQGTVLKQPIRIEYLIKQKSRGALAEKQVLLGAVGSYHIIFL